MSYFSLKIWFVLVQLSIGSCSLILTNSDIGVAPELFLKLNIFLLFDGKGTMKIKLSCNECKFSGIHVIAGCCCQGILQARIFR